MHSDYVKCMAHTAWHGHVIVYETTVRLYNNVYTYGHSPSLLASRNVGHKFHWKLFETDFI